jgi:hypothetical protein
MKKSFKEPITIIKLSIVGGVEEFQSINQYDYDINERPIERTVFSIDSRTGKLYKSYKHFYKYSDETESIESYSFYNNDFYLSEIKINTFQSSDYNGEIIRNLKEVKRYLQERHSVPMHDLINLPIEQFGKKYPPKKNMELFDDISYKYDEYGKKVGEFSKTINSFYNKGNLSQGEKYNLNEVVFKYDNNSNCIEESSYQNKVLNIIRTYKYDINGNLIRQIYKEGTNSAVIIDYIYNENGLLIEEKGSNGYLVKNIYDYKGIRQNQINSSSLWGIEKFLYRYSDDE